MIIKEEFESKFSHFEKALNSLKESLTFDLGNNENKYKGILRYSNIQRFYEFIKIKYNEGYFK